MKTTEPFDLPGEGDPLPQAIEAEQAVIGALLRDNAGVDLMGALAPALFMRHDHRLIFTELMRQIGAGHACDVISVGVALGEAVPGAMAYLNAMAQSCPSAANIARYAELVRDRALRRALLVAAGELTDMALRPGQRSGMQVLDAAQSTLAALAETRAEREPLHIGEAMVQYMEVVAARERGDVGAHGIATGFAGLDALFNGGPNRGNFVIIGARPSMGKTALAVNIACNVARDLSVLVLSMEMVGVELIDRVLADFGAIPLDAVKSCRMDAFQMARYAKANVALRALGLHIDEQPGLSLLQVRAKARRVKRRHGLDVLVIDYLQLMSGDGANRDNRNAQIEAISRGLKALAKELDIVVIALSQLNRGGANKARPQLSDLRDSGAIEQDADIVVFVHRDEVDNPNSHLKGLADLFVAKNRQGRIDDVLLEYEGQFTRFRDTSRRRPPDPASARGPRKGLASHL